MIGGTLVYPLISPEDKRIRGILTSYGPKVIREDENEHKRGILTISTQNGDLKVRLKTLKTFEIDKNLDKAIRETLQYYMEHGEFPRYNPGELWNRWLAFIKSVLYHPDERIYGVILAWGLATWFHPIFDYFPSLVPQGEAGTGKSMILRLLRGLVFNPTPPRVSVSKSYLYRAANESKKTILLNLVGLSRESENDLELQSILEGMTEKGSDVGRVDPENLDASSINIFTPVATATRTSIPIGKKAIVIRTERAPKGKYRGVGKKMDEFRESGEVARCMVPLSLELAKEVKEAYERITQEPIEGLDDRDMDYWAPLFAIVKVFAPENLQMIIEFAKDYAKQYEPHDIMAEIEEAILLIIWARRSDSIKWHVRGLQREIENEVGIKVTPQRVKDALKNLKIHKAIKSEGKYKYYYINFEEVERKLKERGLFDENEVRDESTPKSEDLALSKCGLEERDLLKSEITSNNEKLEEEEKSYSQFPIENQLNYSEQLYNATSLRSEGKEEYYDQLRSKVGEGGYENNDFEKGNEVLLSPINQVELEVLEDFEYEIEFLGHKVGPLKRGQLLKVPAAFAEELKKLKLVRLVVEQREENEKEKRESASLHQKLGKKEKKEEKEESFEISISSLDLKHLPKSSDGFWSERLIVVSCPICGEEVGSEGLDDHLDKHGITPLRAALDSWRVPIRSNMEKMLSMMGKKRREGDITFFKCKLEDFKARNDLQGWLDFIYALSEVGP
ncbi:MAG: hypothetical protein QXI51_03025 [Candidatus Korarchaeum sp.]